MEIASKPKAAIGFTVREALEGDLSQARTVIMRVLEEDFGYGFMPEWHWDLDYLKETYLDNPRQGLFVAADDVSGEILGTTAVRTGGPKFPPHPQWLAARYDLQRTAQLYRVYIAKEHRRRGIARALVEACRHFVAREGGYDVIYLHTNTKIPGAEAFWRSMPTVEILDDRGKGGPYETVHFELEIPGKPLGSAGA